MDAKTKTIIAQGLIIVALAFLLFDGFLKSRRGSALPSQDGMVSKHTFTPTAPLRALDKREIAAVARIPKDILKDDRKEILATGEKRTDSGTSTIAAVLDKTTGDTALVEKRPFFELMSRNELGLGIGMTDGGMTRQLFYRNTFARMGDFYASAMIEAHDGAAGPASWSAVAQISYRW